MSQPAAAAAALHAAPTDDRFSFAGATGGKVGMWIFLLTDGMSFFGLLLGYGILRSGSHTWPRPLDLLGMNFTAVMTFILICSSVTMVMALAGAQEKNKKALCGWLALTILGGLFFLCGQVYEYSHLIREGITLSGGALDVALRERHLDLLHNDARFCSTFFIITGFHGCHVFTGVTYLTVTLIQAMKGKFTDGPKASANHVELAGLFWHFVDLVWILVFTFIYLV